MREDTIKYIANHYGVVHQSKKAIEEMSELTKALCKIEEYPSCDPKASKYLDDVIEEIADVSIMIEQLKHLYGSREVDAVIERKLARQMRRIKIGGD